MQMKSLRPGTVKTPAQIPETNEQWNQSHTLESDSGQGPSSFFFIINTKKEPHHSIHFCACSDSSLHASGTKIITEELRIENDYCLCRLSGLMFEREVM